MVRGSWGVFDVYEPIVDHLLVVVGDLVVTLEGAYPVVMRASGSVLDLSVIVVNWYFVRFGDFDVVPEFSMFA